MASNELPKWLTHGASGDGESDTPPPVEKRSANSQQAPSTGQGGKGKPNRIYALLCRSTEELETYQKLEMEVASAGVHPDNPRT